MRTVRLCSVEGCDNKHSGRGYCGMHYARIKRNGDLTKRKTGPKAIDGIEYRAMHMRLERERGKARWYFCSNCPSKGYDWALMPDATEVRYSNEPAHLGLPFVTDIRFYEPLCRTCHRAQEVSA